MTAAFLSLLYTDKTEVLSPYSFSTLEHLIYGDHFKKGQLEMNLLEPDQMFILAFIHGFLSMKSFSPEINQEELFNLSGLLIVNIRFIIRADKRPCLFELGTRKLNYPSQSKLQKSVSYYKHDFQLMADHLNSIQGFGRTYITATKEFIGFLDKFSRRHEMFLTPRLKDILINGHDAFINRRTLPDTNFIQYLQQTPLGHKTA